MASQCCLLTMRWNNRWNNPPRSNTDTCQKTYMIFVFNHSKNQENKVKREGEVLMGLEHSRILRYYQSWSARIIDPVILKSFAVKEDLL